jgi:hypothetical protein
VLLANPTIGRAVIANPDDFGNPRSVIAFPAPVNAAAAGAKVSLSPDGQTLYVIGSPDAGGLAAYDVPSGSPVASYADSTMYSSVYVLPSGTVVGATTNPPLLNFFDSALHLTASVPSAVYAIAIY